MATFTSLGVVLFTMEAELHWTITSDGIQLHLSRPRVRPDEPAAGHDHAILGWARHRLCRRHIAGDRLFPGVDHPYAADVLCGDDILGAGYSFSGNVPAVYLIAGWFDRSAGRMIGIYMMLGAAGAAIGPPIVEAVVRLGGWRGHWQAMAAMRWRSASSVWLWSRMRRYPK